VLLDRVNGVRSAPVLGPSVLRNVGALSITGFGLYLYSDDLKRSFSLKKARCDSSSDFTRAALDKPVTVEKKEHGAQQMKGSWKLKNDTSFGADQIRPGYQNPPPQTKASKKQDEDEDDLEVGPDLSPVFI
jgi:hypothetical protein